MNFIKTLLHDLYMVVLMVKTKILVKKRKRKKVFVIGFNKTGTTTLKRVLEEFDYILGNQAMAEQLMDTIISGKYRDLYEYCKTGEAFQDVPFSNPRIFKLLDKKFPESKFILTIRNNELQWFNSIKKFHSNSFAAGETPSEEDLKNVSYVKKGWVYKIHTYKYGFNLYDKEIYTKIYNEHITDVKEYFKHRPYDFLIVNVSNNKDYQKICKFLGHKSLRNDFPWENKTE